VRSGVTQQEIEETFAHLDPFSTYGLILSGAGLFCSFWGGYVCALNSKIHVLRDTAFMAVLSVTTGILLAGDTYSAWQHLILATIGVMVIFAGAGLWMRTHR